MGDPVSPLTHGAERKTFEKVKEAISSQIKDHGPFPCAQ